MTRTWLRLRKLAEGARSSQGRRALRRGVAASIEHNDALGSMRFRTVVDVGANRGQFALFARRRWPEAQILSFEPLAEAAQAYDRLFLHDDRATLHHLALGVENGRAVVHVASEDDSSSLLPFDARQTRLFGTREVATRETSLRRLDSVIVGSALQPAALLKIDTQGFELPVLRGAEGILSGFAAVYAELSFRPCYVGQALAQEVVDFLGARGFHLAGVFNQYLSPSEGAVQADFLFTRTGSERQEGAS